MHRLRFGLIILIAASVLGGCKPAGNDGAAEQSASRKSVSPASDFLTALDECHALYEATAGVEHPLFEQNYQQYGGSGTALMSFLGKMMEKDYRPVVEKSNAALERADASLGKLVLSASISDSVKQDYESYSVVIRHNNSFFSDPQPMKFLAKWFNEHASEKELYDKIRTAIAAAEAK